MRLEEICGGGVDGDEAFAADGCFLPGDVLVEDSSELGIREFQWICGSAFGCGDAQLDLDVVGVVVLDECAHGALLCR